MVTLSIHISSFGTSCISPINRGVFAPGVEPFGSASLVDGADFPSSSESLYVHNVRARARVRICVRIRVRIRVRASMHPCIA